VKPRSGQGQISAATDFRADIPARKWVAFFVLNLEVAK
jgi:hypothetical protein